MISDIPFKRLGQLLLSGALLLNALVGCAKPRCERVTGLRAAWMQAHSITTSQEADRMLSRLEAGRFNALFVNVFVYGYAYYESDLLEKHPDLAPDYDPLAYITQQAHQRDLEVHVWLVAGPIGGGEWSPSPILRQHPEWEMMSLDGEGSGWLNYNRPDVRRFIGDLALEIVRRYAVDGLHFDYTRYPHPGWKWGFDPYSAEAFARASGLDLEVLRYAELPAYGSFAGNPLADPVTAQVLATFEDGQPAITLNRHGSGQVMVFNWAADRRRIAASSEILDRGLDYLRGQGGEIYLLRSETNVRLYGSGDFDKVATWLRDIGRPPVTINVEELAVLESNAVVVMPNVYRITAQEASVLADFVYRGGGVIFIDGPTESIGDSTIQAITGMRTRGRHFKETHLLIATGEHEIIPNSERGTELAPYQDWNERWTAFRAAGINDLVQSVYQRVKQQAPQVQMTITVSADHETLSERHFLDWQTWLEAGYVDLIIPRAYVNHDQSLKSIIAEWQSAIRRSEKMMLGLRAFDYDGKGRTPKAPRRVLSEVNLACASGSNGIILFDIERTSDEVLEALANGPFAPAVDASE